MNDPKVLAGLKAAYLATEDSRVKSDLRDAWRNATGIFLVFEQVEAEIRAWETPVADPSLAESIYHLNARVDGLAELIRTLNPVCFIAEPAVDFPEAAPDDPVCATCGKTRGEHSKVIGYCDLNTISTDKFSPVPAPPAAPVIVQCPVCGGMIEETKLATGVWEGDPHCKCPPLPRCPHGREYTGTFSEWCEECSKERTPAAPLDPVLAESRDLAIKQDAIVTVLRRYHDINSRFDKPALNRMALEMLSEMGNP